MRQKNNFLTAAAVNVTDAVGHAHADAVKTCFCFFVCVQRTDAAAAGSRVSKPGGSAGPGSAASDRPTNVTESVQERSGSVNIVAMYVGDRVAQISRR